ncbi:hypothetical protein N7466_006906 [Penicillium verhagenii]|uniref:uncharacterized protein n=1 Tax=Penicillium verhagenii TaxID=1562060 RepID=UPI002545B4AB|nr:uncharacterized protein N7466_006906 [Penicillium verhagenii]KAJ5927950.1 hypothetical protein N7466_006906 [Penicillium verhagenii]
MSNPSDRPWTEGEKYFLLTEILKKAGIPSSYLVRMIHEHRIQPSWDHIPLPPGRTMSSCKMVFDNMQSQFHQYPPVTAAVSAPVQMARPEGIRSSAPPIDPNLRKRPLYFENKPRAIQPRPPASVASYSSESGTSAQLSPRLEGPATGNPGEPPRKRGRPSKLETERRKAAAEARGETYPPPRRSGSGRSKIPPSPSSPSVPLAAYAHPGHTQPSAPGPGSTPNPNPSTASSAAGPSTSTPYETGVRPIAPAPSLPGPEERRDVPTRTMGPMRELPRLQEMGPLPSPRILQLGPRENIARDNVPRFHTAPIERGAYDAIQDRFSPEGGRRDSVTSRGDSTPKGPGPGPGPGSSAPIQGQGPGPYDRRASNTPGENPR